MCCRETDFELSASRGAWITVSGYREQYDVTILKPDAAGLAQCQRSKRVSQLRVILREEP